MSFTRASAVLVLALAFGCGSEEGATSTPSTAAGRAPKAAKAANAPTADAPAPDLGAALSAALSSPAPTGTENAMNEPLRVLVTGFNDWKDLGDPANVWRCRDNPSCRLLLGSETLDRPTTHEGPLVRMLERRTTTANGRAIAWSFGTMPVTWGIADTLPDYADYDVVVHLGLGVYDTFDVLQLEDGAYNGRRGADAVGREADEAIASSTAQVLDAAAGTPIASRVRTLDGRSFGDYTLRVARARPDNSYLCNETHFRALERVNASVEAGQRLRQAYFVHIPYAEHDDYARLAQGVAGVVFALVD